MAITPLSVPRYIAYALEQAELARRGPVESSSATAPTQTLLFISIPTNALISLQDNEAAEQNGALRQ